MKDLGGNSPKLFLDPAGPRDVPIDRIEYAHGPLTAHDLGEALEGGGLLSDGRFHQPEVYLAEKSLGDNSDRDLKTGLLLATMVLERAQWRASEET